MVAISIAPLLSSNTLHFTLGVLEDIGNLCAFISFKSSMIGIASLNECKSPVYSISVLLKVIYSSKL